MCKEWHAGWSVQDHRNPPMLWSTRNSLPVYTNMATYGCWCIHSVVQHLGILKESILNTLTWCCFLKFFFCDAHLPQHVCINCSSCHPPLSCSLLTSIASPLWVCHFSRHCCPLFHPGQVTGMSTWVNTLRAIELLPIVPRGWNSFSLSLSVYNIHECVLAYFCLDTCLSWIDKHIP